MPKVRTRNAPSPTGVPQMGNTRTALFDYLLAKKYHGQFILRIEDTDQKREVPGSIEKIYEIHDFLGLIPDEDPRKGGPFSPYIQTQRLKSYQDYAQKLVELGVAYEKEGAIRIKMPKAGYTTWQDMVQGKVSIKNDQVDDKVLLKSNGIPTYHLAVVIDDHLMEISHILRGVEWIVSTPVHLYLYQSLGWQPPIFAHVPLLLGPDRSKLSKRHGAKSVLEYRDDGYLPEAIDNFLFYLGFSYKDNSEILTLSQMAKIFDETKLQKQNAIFDITKLNYFNGAWIRHLTPADFAERLKLFLPEEYQTSNQLKQILPLIQTRITTLKEAQPLISFFFTTPKAPAQTTETKKYLSVAQQVITDCNWDKSCLETNFIRQVEQNNFPKADFFMALRLAVCGVRITPPLTESMLIIGREEVVKRLQNALK